MKRSSYLDPGFSCYVSYGSGSQTWGRDPKWGPQIILWGPPMYTLVSIFFSLSHK